MNWRRRSAGVVFSPKSGKSDGMVVDGGGWGVNSQKCAVLHHKKVLKRGGTKDAVERKTAVD